MPRVHRAISNFKTWLRGTHRSVTNEHLQADLDEFTFRYNRRRTPMAAFQTLLGLVLQSRLVRSVAIAAEFEARDPHDSAPLRMVETAPVPTKTANTTVVLGADA